MRFVEHVADAAIEVRARSAEACFARAAAGMFGIFVSPAADGAAIESVGLDVTGPGPAELLVAWLEELLYLSEVRSVALQTFTASRVMPSRAAGSAEGCRFGPDAVVVGPVVKGVSRHGLELRQTGGGWFARVIFDV